MYILQDKKNILHLSEKLNPFGSAQNDDECHAEQRRSIEIMSASQGRYWIRSMINTTYAL